MSSVVDCDLTFDLLTRGPFPNGNPSDQTVEDHLRVCHECRMLAEALRPGVDLFHECLDSADTGQLPRYDGQSRLENQVMDAVRAAASQNGGNVAASESVELPTSVPAVVRIRQVVQLVLAPAILFLCAALFLRGNGGIAGIASADGVELRPVSGVELLEMLAVHDACQVPNAHANTKSAGYHCCTECHSVRDSAESTAIPCMNRLSVSCNACHLPEQKKHSCCGDCHAGDADSAAILAYCREQVSSTCDTCHTRVPG